MEPQEKPAEIKYLEIYTSRQLAMLQWSHAIESYGKVDIRIRMTLN